MLNKQLTDEERAIYQWQMWVPDFGEAGQERLKNASVMISRVGGIGVRLLFIDPFGFAQGTRCGGSPPAGSRPGNSGSPCGHAHEPGHELTHWKKASQPTN